MSKKVTIDSILARLTEEASRPAIKEICVDAINEIQRLRSICSEAQVFIQHAPNCGTSMEWAKDCSCGYDQMWSKLDV